VTIKNDEEIPGQIARRNWIVLALFLFVSLFWQSPAVILGVLSGGGVALLSFHWLQFSLIRMFINLDSGATRQFKSSFLLRLSTVTALLYLLVVIVRVNPLALAAGLSVVVVSLVWTAIERLRSSRRP
jgi:predicted branched-subunit amino acid permease